MELEQWVPVKTKGFKGRYLISNFGQVKSIKNDIILKPFINISGRYYVVLSKNGAKETVSVSRLVLIHYNRFPNQKEISAFLDLNATNNNIENLNWMTRGDWRRYKRSIKGRIKGVYKVKIKNNEYYKSSFKYKNKIKIFGYFKTKQEAIDCTYQTFMTKFGYAPW